MSKKNASGVREEKYNNCPPQTLYIIAPVFIILLYLGWGGI